MTGPPWDRLWVDVHLATMEDEELGPIPDGAIASSRDRIAWVGRREDLPGPPGELAGEVRRGDGAWLLPGLIDCHTHIVFGGDRSGEFRERLHGASYEDIARRGGGIMSTVRATRQASEDELVEGALGRARELAAWGVTTVEIKSGYGLETDTELRMLRAASRVGARADMDVETTLLGAHTVPDEYRGRPDEYVDLVVGEMIPRAVAEGVASAVDVFCETIAFDPGQSRRVLEAGIGAGLGGRLHADQLSDSGGGALAAAVGARSADHLEFLSEEGAAAMAEGGVTAVLLPGAFYSLRETRPPPVPLLRSHGVPMALATDANPGSSPMTHVGAVLNMACVLFRLTPEEALAGMTRVAARVLGLEGDRGVLAVGKRADFSLWAVPDPVWLTYWLGPSPLRERVKDGVPRD